MSDTDLELLACYARQHVEDAFTEIVRRHVDLVYSAALRQVRSPQLAEEVAQSTFLNLARHVGRLAPGTVLTAWLYQVARREAVDVVRREARRQLREQIATEMSATNAAADNWMRIEPLLDEAMDALDDTDRAAVLLRYFENKSLREVGQSLGTSENAAQKRLSRAVERLRGFFAKRGVTVGVGGLVALISGNAVQSAPLGMAVAISTSAVIAGTSFATTAAAGTATTALTKAIAMTILQKTMIGATLVVAVGTGIYKARQASNLRSEAQILQQKVNQLTRDRDEATKKLVVLQQDNHQMRKDTAELARLRGEIGLLRRMARSTNENTAKALGTPNAPKPSSTRALVPSVYAPRVEWGDVGTDSPEAALQTLFWALSTTNLDRVVTMIKWDMNDSSELLKALRRGADATTGAVRIEGVPEFMKDAVSGSSQAVAELQGLRFQSAETNAQGQTVMSFETTSNYGVTTSCSLRFFRTAAGQWGPLMKVREFEKGIQLDWAEP